MATRRGGTAFAATTSVANIALTIPGTVQDDDFAWVIHPYNPSTADTTTPAGWTVIDELSFSATARCRLYERQLLAANAGASVTFANALGQRLAAWMGVYFDTLGLNAMLGKVATAGTDHTAATVSSTAIGGAINLWAERSSTPSGSIGAPSGYALRDTAFGVGSGATSVAGADKLASVASGSSLGGGVWTPNVDNNAQFMWTLGIEDTPSIVTVTKDLVIAYDTRLRVGNGMTGDISDLLNTAGTAMRWDVLTTIVSGVVGARLPMPVVALDADVTTAADLDAVMPALIAAAAADVKVAAQLEAILPALRANVEADVDAVVSILAAEIPALRFTGAIHVGTVTQPAAIHTQPVGPAVAAQPVIAGPALNARTVNGPGV